MEYFLYFQGDGISKSEFLIQYISIYIFLNLS